MQTIELYSDPDYVVQVLLDGTLYFLKFSWNSEALFWVMGVEDFARNPIIAGIKLIPNMRLLSRYRSDQLPQGELIVISDSNGIGRTDFADQYARLVYVTESEL